MNTLRVSKIFDTSTLKGLKSAERYKAKLNNRYFKVQVITLGLTRVQITGSK